jgi:PEP-CTERM motif
MKRSILLFSALVAGGVAVSAQTANAALVNDLVTFTGSGITSAFGEPVPTDPVTGSFTITFDPTQTYVDQTVGITLKSLNIVLDSALSFDYSPTGNTHGDADELVVGGLQDGADSTQISPTVFNDFILHIMTYSSTPTFQQVLYTTASATPDTNLFFTDLPESGAGSVTVTPIIPGGVPEPSTWAMMLAGFAGLGFLGYRQTAKARAAA